MHCFRMLLHLDLHCPLSPLLTLAPSTFASTIKSTLHMIYYATFQLVDETALP